MNFVPRDWKHPDAQLVSEYSFKNGHTVPMFKVQTIHALNQLVGYAKFLNKNLGKILFRGQGGLYDSLHPSLYRVDSSKIITRNTKILKYIRDCSASNRMFNGVDDYSKEPLLQHYGIKTRWLDLVDNLWIALWFSMHEYKTQAFDRVYEFVIPRVGIATCPGVQKSYLLLIFTDAIS